VIEWNGMKNFMNEKDVYRTTEGIYGIKEMTLDGHLCSYWM
jgi:hypothetical protein